MKTRIFIFSYARDRAILPHCIACARAALPEAVIIVIDDSAAPCDLPVDGVEWRTSSFDRGGNLRGRACVEGMIEEMIRDAADDDVCIKLDCDTAMLTPRPIERMIAAGAGGAGSYSPALEFHGCLYAFRASSLRKMLARLDHIELDHNHPEDLAMYALARDAGINLLAEPCWLPDRTEGRWTAFNFPARPDPVKYRSFDVVTLGNNRAAVPDSEMIRVFQSLHSFQQNKQQTTKNRK